MRAPRGTWANVALQVAIVVAYVVSGRFGLTLAYYNKMATLLWAPSGIAVAAVWLLRSRALPAVALGAFVTNLTVGASPLLALCIALGNTAEAWIADRLIDRARLRGGLNSVRDVVLFVGLVVSAATLVAALNASVWLALLTDLPRTSLLPTGLIWWLGDAGGVLVVTPFVLSFARGRSHPPRASRLPEGVLLAVLAPAVASLSFGFVLPSAHSSTALALLPFPLLIWGALRFGLRGASAMSAAITVTAVLGTAAGKGPFRGGGPHAEVASVWSLLAALSITSLLIAVGLEERERESQARADREHELEQSKRLTELGMLAGGIAHDFNNLLMVVRANVELARVGHHTADCLEAIDSAAVRAAELTRQLLAYAGRRDIERREIDLGTLTSEMMRLLGPGIPDRVALDVVVETALRLEGDPTQLRQLVMNLALNAVQAIEGDGVVSVRVAVDNDAALLEVRDDGRGMDRETLARVYQPFFSTKGHGRGLGMAAVLGIARSHGGEVTIDSTPGAGTTVSVRLPLLKVGALESPSSRTEDDAVAQCA